MTSGRPQYVTVQQLAEVAAITFTAAKGAVRRGRQNKPWRNVVLVIKDENGRGGASGRRSLVLVESLPTDIQERARKLLDELAARSEPTASLHVPGSATGRELAPASGKGVIRPRRPRSDKGERRVFVSQLYDAATGFDEATLERIADATKQDVLSLWATDQRGWRTIRRLALTKLMELTTEAGFAGSKHHLKAICTLPRGFIDKQRIAGLAVARYQKDAKGHFDRQPRIRRDWSQVGAGEFWIGDVHPLDVLYQRDDGSTATARAICWMDGRSRFLVAHPVFLDKGQGVRMEHAAASFAHMVVTLGTMPRWLYLDNGGEFNWADFAADAMRLAGDPRFALQDINGDDARALMRALAYNAPAKPIEPRFPVLENALRDLPGWIGGDRMKAKTHNVGKAPLPFPGAPHELWDEIQRRVDYINNVPMDVLDWRTPAQVLADRPHHDVKLTDLQTAFAREKKVALRQGEFRLDNVYYGADELDRCSYMERVVICIPIFGGRDLIGVKDTTGSFICHASPRRSYGPLDIEGAKESARRKRLARDGVRAIGEHVQDVDVSDRMAAFVALNPVAASRATPAEISLTGEAALAANDRRRLQAKGRPRAKAAANRADVVKATGYGLLEARPRATDANGGE